MPRVFLSYAHEGPEHCQWVMDLGKLLRENGVDAYLDKWDLIPGQDNTYFMESQIRDSDFVILICTPLYATKSNIPQGGVGYEKNIISAEMLQSSDLRPKFIPILRQGTFDNALPTYLGSKYAIDFRETQEQSSALDELIRAIYIQPHPDKLPLGPNPFEKVDSKTTISSSAQIESPIIRPVLIQQNQDIHLWEKEASGRFEYLCSKKLNKEKENPFNNGYWQASFVLLSKPDIISLNDFLEKLRTSKTRRTGWDIGWVPTRSGIAPYPYQQGIEVWLAEDGGEGPGYSDFWRAETSGRFALFRGYQEDEIDFRKQLKLQEQDRIIDFSITLWRVTEFLLYLESFSKQMSIGDSRAILKITWRGLENRKIRCHKHPIKLFEDYICHQDLVHSDYEIKACSDIRKNLLNDVRTITMPLFEAFNFFALTEEKIKNHIKQLFDPEKEVV